MTAYAGDLSPREAWERLTSDPKAKLVDVRTQPEWVYVGIPDLAPLDKKPVLVSWQTYPTMAKNEAFAEQLKSQGVQPDDTVLLLCRSGVRSQAAAELLSGLGYKAAYNIVDGFEGPLNETRQRGAAAGWKASGLPWAQG